MRTTHGHTVAGQRSPTYASWASMHDRCLNPKDKGYPYYGGRGITICERWRGETGFKNFLADMGPRPRGKSIDRFPNNDGNYEPGNCRWATAKQQINNRRPLPLKRPDAPVDEIKALYESGVTTREIAEKFGIHQATAIKRLHRAGVTLRPSIVDGRKLHRIEDVPHTKPGEVELRHDVPTDELVRLYQEGLSAAEIARRFDVDRGTVLNRLRIRGIEIRHHWQWSKDRKAAA